MDPVIWHDESLSSALLQGSPPALLSQAPKLPPPSGFPLIFAGRKGVNNLVIKGLTKHFYAGVLGVCVRSLNIFIVLEELR